MIMKATLMESNIFFEDLPPKKPNLPPPKDNRQTSKKVYSFHICKKSLKIWWV